MQTKHLTLEVTKAKDDAGEWWVASAADVDRQGDVVDQSGWQLDNYKRNPILFFGHDGYNNPYHVIGKAADIRVEGGKLRILPKWRKPAAANDPMHVIKALIDDGTLRALSVGFRPLDEPQRNNSGGVDFGRVELLEVSLVPIPALATATRAALEAVAKGMAAPADDDDDDELPPVLFDALVDAIDDVAELYGIEVE